MSDTLYNLSLIFTNTFLSLGKPTQRPKRLTWGYRFKLTQHEELEPM